ncbi:MAG: hypothetical protein KDI75_01335 [Xanthomonadales bacterium]|nr:hypothetical protein [Xanthomonadales bacterium]
MRLQPALIVAWALLALSAGRFPVVHAAASTASAGPATKTVAPRGELWPLASLTDESFGVSVRALALRREVRMYQWRAQTGTDGSVSWSREWSSERIVIPAALRDADHVNPGRMPFPSAAWRASQVELDGHLVDTGLFAHFNDWQPHPVDTTSLPPNLAASFSGDEGCIHSGRDAAKPAIGDLRICWEQLPAGPVEGVVRLEADRWVAGEVPVTRGVQHEDFALDVPERVYWLMGGALLAGFLLFALAAQRRRRE